MWSSKKVACLKYLQHFVYNKENNVKIELGNVRGGVVVLRFFDDFAGAFYDLFKCMIKSLSYVIAGMIIVGVPMYLFVWLFGMFQ